MTQLDLPVRPIGPAAQALRILELLLVASLLTGPFSCWHAAFSQQQSPPGLDRRIEARAIIAHLNAVIQFYRSVNQPIQRAGEPNDVIYRDQAVAEASQIARYAFQSARAEAQLLAEDYGQGAGPPLQSGEQQRIQTARAQVQQRIAALRTRLAIVDREIATARTAASLRKQRQQLQAALDLSSAMNDALGRISSIAGGVGASGLTGDIDRLQQSVPELQSGNKTSSPQLITVMSALSAGITTQGSVLFDLLETRHSLQDLIDQNEHLRQRAVNLRSPMLNILRALVQQGEQLSAQAAQAPPPSARAEARLRHQPPAPEAKGPSPASSGQPQLETITARFKSLSAATVPLSQEIILLDQSHANLTAWQTAIAREYNRIAAALLLRVLVIAIALVIIIGGGEIWTRAANKYIRDIRRRRQILVVRRVVVGFLSVLVIVFGFVTQFQSLATFAGFITAGIAVGLQTILLSVAAYFFIIGRFGIKVGDRITIASVTGDVIDVGLVRFYLMEMAGSGTELKPTGRVAVFSNAVLFQALTPLYKQMPGTGYAWHELIVKLTDAADYRTVCEAIAKEIESVYRTYRENIVRQHQAIQNWMHASMEVPEIESRLQFSGGAFQLWARFPVELHNAAATDEKVTRALLNLMAANPAVKTAVASTPVIQAAVRG